MELCYLVDILPQASPDVVLKITRFEVDPDGEALVAGTLFVNKVEKTGTINGNLYVQKYEKLDGPPVEELSGKAIFPVEVRLIPGPYRFFRLLVKDEDMRE